MGVGETGVEIEQAQDELRRGYLLGAPGVAVSGVVWLAAGVVWTIAGPGPAFATLFIGGMAIFPLSQLIARGLFAAPPVAKANPLNRLGLETTVPLFAGLFVAFAVLPRSAPLAFALFATIVGARYFAFATLYRDRTYWLLGAAMFAAGCLFARGAAAIPVNVALVTGAIEAIFAVVLFVRSRAHR